MHPSWWLRCPGMVQAHGPGAESELSLARPSLGPTKPVMLILGLEEMVQIGMSSIGCRTSWSAERCWPGLLEPSFWTTNVVAFSVLTMLGILVAEVTLSNNSYLERRSLYIGKLKSQRCHRGMSFPNFLFIALLYLNLICDKLTATQTSCLTIGGGNSLISCSTERI